MDSNKTNNGKIMQKKEVKDNSRNSKQTKGEAAFYDPNYKDIIMY